MAMIGRPAAPAPLNTGDLPDGVVTTAKIAADAIDGTKLADNAVDSEHITAAGIDTAHLGNLQVTAAKVAADVATQAELDAKDIPGITSTGSSATHLVTVAGNLAVNGSYVKFPSITTSARDELTPAAGMLIYNSTLGMTQQYTAVGWKSIDAPPAVTSISPTTQGGYTADVVVTGSNFSTGFTARFVGADNTQYTPASTVYTNATTVTLRTPATGLPASNEPYDIKITNASGLAATLENALDAGGVPAFTTSAGTLGNVWDMSRTNPALSTAAAVDPDSNPITYAVSVGALPGGLSLNTSTAAITGTATAVGSDTTTNFTISATTANGDTASRAFSITVKPPATVVFVYTGADQTFTVPAFSTGFVVKAWGAGGGRGQYSSSGGAIGGPGGFSVGAVTSTTGGTVFKVVVGRGGESNANADGTTGSSGASVDYGGGGSLHGSGTATSGRGGGLAGVFSGSGAIFTGSGALGTTVAAGAFARAVIVAGAGGSGGYNTLVGGYGGGTTGGRGGGGSGTGGYGGTQSAGGDGTQGGGCPGEDGGQLYGGFGGNPNSGGGGSGYYGGGGGTCAGSDGQGGGGSGYIGGVSSALGVTAAMTTNTSGYAAPNTGDADYQTDSSTFSGNENNGVGAQDANIHGRDGGHGLVVIKY